MTLTLYEVLPGKTIYDKGVEYTGGATVELPPESALVHAPNIKLAAPTLPTPEPTPAEVQQEEPAPEIQGETETETETETPRRRRRGSTVADSDG